MPTVPRRPCRASGCPNLCERGEQFCDDHRRDNEKRYNDSRDAELTEFYNSGRWRALRNRFIREHPLCRECAANGLTRAAMIVDHIVPIRQGGAKFDERNLQALCWSCHSKKSIEEGSRFGGR